MNQFEKERLKQLIDNGFDINVISFEFDIPLDEVKQLKMEIDMQRSKEAIKQEKTTQGYYKMKELRGRYRSLYSRRNQNFEETSKKISERQTDIVNSTIVTVKKSISEMKDASKKDKRSKANTIISEIENIQEYPLTVEQAETLIELLNSEELKGLSTISNNSIENSLRRCRTILIKSLISAIDSERKQNR